MEALRQAMVSYRSWVDFLCIIQSDEKSNESEFYITDVFELNSCVFFVIYLSKREDAIVKWVQTYDMIG